MMRDPNARRRRGAGWLQLARLVRLGVTLGVLGGTLASCAYYNTFYLARKYYYKATDGQPYEVDRDGTGQRPNYSKSSDYSKKLLGVYPKSKWVDDAWLMWAKSLIGTDDPLKAIAMLEEFQTRFPKSELRPDAEFFLGLACRAARKYEQSVQHFDEFLAQAPKHELAPYACYERSKALMSLQLYSDAAASASRILDRWPKHVLADRALRQRAEARFQQHAWEGARQDFHEIGERALNDDDRLRYLLREVDCLEANRQFDDARNLLRDARAHVDMPPPVPDPPRAGTTTASTSPVITQTYVAPQPGQERYGRLTLRMGGVELLAGNVDKSVELYQNVLHDYPRSQLAAEAQFSVGYAYETGADDFQRARGEYAKVKDLAGTSQFSQQAQQRLDNLDRIERYRTASGADSAERKAEARFLTAEHYLFNLERPERAIEEYQSIVDSSTSPAVKGRALNAQGWVLSRKLHRTAAADSVFWRVVREFPSTEAQLAARDYLEAEGHTVPEKLIVAPVDSATLVSHAEDVVLTQPPSDTPQLGSHTAPLDPSSAHFGPGAGGAAAAAAATAPSSFHLMPQPWRDAQVPDSVRHEMLARDSLLHAARQDTSAAGRARADSLHQAFANADTAGRGAQFAAIQASVPHPQGVVIADSTHAPSLSGGDSSAVHSPSRLAVGATGAAVAAGSAPLPPTLPVEGNYHAPADSTHGRSAGKAADPAHPGASGKAAATTGAAAGAAAHKPAKPKGEGGPISSVWVTYTRAERDSIKHAKVVSDSLKKAEKEAEKAAKKAARAAKQAAADSAKGGTR